MKIIINPKQHNGKSLLEIAKDYQENDLLLPDYTPSSASTAAAISINLEQLMLMAPSLSLPKAATILPDLNRVMSDFEINLKLERSLFFLSNLLHESGEFKYTEEIASGQAYEYRTDLGNTPVNDGDGPRHKGYGYFQITGVTNQRKFGEYILSNNKYSKLYADMYDEFPDKYGNPVMRNPKMIKDAPWNMISAGWFWRVLNKLSSIADTGDFYRICVKINGGTNGLADRIKYLNWCKAILNEYKHLAIIPSLEYKIKKE